MAGCEAASACLQAQGRLRLLLEPSYAVLEFELASALHCIIHSHWQRLLQNSAFRPSVQVLRPPARLFLTLCHSCRQSHATDCRAEIQNDRLPAVERGSHERRAVAINYLGMPARLVSSFLLQVAASMATMSLGCVTSSGYVACCHVRAECVTLGRNCR